MYDILYIFGRMGFGKFSHFSAVCTEYLRIKLVQSVKDYVFFLVVSYRISYYYSLVL